jgi:hypothetical protein
MKGMFGSRRARIVLAILLAIGAVALIVGEPFPKGDVLLSVTSTHGIDVGDLPALVLLLAAAWLAI